jgi:hypothetical protein
MSDGPRVTSRWSTTPSSPPRTPPSLLQTALVGIVEEFLEPGTDFTVGAVVDGPG